jgi:two-component system CheB/CheR fusion protein
MAKKKSPSTPKKESVRKSRPPPATEVPEETKESLDDDVPDFTVVGVGASAGGLEAFSQLVRALPKECTMPIVLVQHLSPEHESLIPALIQGTTHLRAVQATEGVAISPGTIHVIPPNHSMEIDRGFLKLHPRPSGRATFNPIDVFFRSLAHYARHRSIGIVLSGTASDGAAGLAEIKSQGGITIAQKPETAKHDGMPRAAIATGAVDMVLSPIEMANELAVLCRHPYLAFESPTAKSEGEIADDALPPILGILKKATGVDFSQYKTATIKRRLQRRMLIHRLTHVDAYVAMLREKPEEAQRLYQDILIHVTRFFREPESFVILKTEVFPQIFRNRREDDTVRIWVPGCSTGEEAYTVAILVLDYLGEDAGNVPIQIFATDVSEIAVEQARAGIYSEGIANDVSKDHLRRYFTHQNDKYRIQKSVRDLCIFARQDLTRDPPFSKLDLIVCRNVLIYMGPSLQRRVLSVFQYALKPGGFMMLGSAETVGLHADFFTVVDKRHRLYAKKDTGLPAGPMFPIEYGGRIEPIRSRSSEVEFRVGRGIHAEATRLLLERYAPASVLIDSDFQILQTRGRTGQYFELAPGDPSLNVLKMAREGLLHPLREALQKAATVNERVRREGVIVHSDGEMREVNLEVIPVVTPAVPVRHFLVIFEPIPDEGARRKPKKKNLTKLKRDSRIEQLEYELAASRQYLQATIQDLEAANEELQSANEEILSSNEELQSTNEELDTAKEELQSTNEELNTINEELNARNEELTRVNSDLINFLANVDVAIVIISQDLKVRRFTPMAERVLNLIPGDVGRSIQQVKPNIDCPDLEEMILNATHSIATKEREVSDREGRRYLLRVRPYKDIDNRIDGAVLVIFDIETAKKQAAQGELMREAVIQALPKPLVLLDGSLRIKLANDAFWAMAKSVASSGMGRPLSEIHDGDWNFAGLRADLEALAREDGTALKLRLEGESDGGAPRVADVFARRVNSSSENLILLTIEPPGGNEPGTETNH